MAPCPPPELLRGFLDGTLTGPQTDAVGVHVCGCAACQAVLDRLCDDPDLRPPRSAVPPSSAAPGPALARALQTVWASMPATAAAQAPSETPRGDAGDRTANGRPAVLGPYVVEGELGRGGMSIVLRARDTSLGRTVALKVLRPELCDGAARLRLVREARLAARFKHDHVVTVHAVEDAPDGLSYLVMELVEGQTLAARIRERQRLEPREAAEWVAQAADGLAAAHAAGLVHRDVKPGNVMIEAATGRAKVMDFGLARGDGRSDLTREGALSGTPAYMSPEQARGASALDGRTDVYGLGATLYEALTGEAPFQGAPHMVLPQVLGEEPRPPRRLNDRIPRDLETVCLKALAKEPARRYPTAADLAADLRRWLRGEPIQARPAGRLERGWRWCRRNPRVALLTAALAGVFLVGFAGVFWQWRRAEANLLDREEAYLESCGSLMNLNLVDSDELRGQVNILPFLQQRIEDSRLWGGQPERDPIRAFAVALAYHNFGVAAWESDRSDEAPEAFRHSLALLEQLLEKHPRNVTCRTLVGGNHFYLGLLHHARGQEEEAKDAYQRALTVFERMAADLPHDPFRWRTVAVCHCELGDVNLATGRADEARRHYQEARDLLAQVVREAPAQADFQFRLACCDGRLAVLLCEQGNPGAALPLLIEVRDRLAQVVADHPGKRFWRRDRARANLDIALTYRALDRHALARPCLQQAQAELEELVRAFPLVPNLRTRLAEVLVHSATLEREAGRYGPALHGLEQARQLCTVLVRDRPAVTQPRVVLAEGYRETALLRQAQGHSRDAREAVEQARAVWGQLVQEHPTSPRFRAGLAAVEHDWK